MGFFWAMSIPGLACLLVVLAALERLGIWFSGRSWLPWRRPKQNAVVSATGFDQVTALFYATKHYELEHRNTELMLRDDADDGAPRRFRLDLDHDRPTVVVARGGCAGSGGGSLTVRRARTSPL
jgi:hypothetical protein